MSDLETVDHCDLCAGIDLEDLHPAVHAVRCRGCHHVFHSPRPTLAAIRNFYSQVGGYGGWVDQHSERRMPWRYRTALTRKFRAGGRLLDVGAGMGDFLAQARSHFEVLGTELSAEGVRVARDKFNLPLLEGALEDVNLEGRKFDVVTLFHVLEHVPSPASTLRRCRELLEPGGILVVAVPNEGAAGWFKACRGGPRTLGVLATRGPSFFRRLDLRDLPPLEAIDLTASPRDANLHLHHFAPAVLIAAIERAGFRIRHFGIDPHVPAAGVWWLRYRLRILPFQLAYWLTGVLAYETMLIVAERNGGWQ